MTESFPKGWGASGFAVVVPARNEASRLPRLLRSLDRDAAPMDILVVANGCDDATAAVARAWRGPHPVAVVETPRHPGGVGRARRLGCAVALSRMAAGGLIATTDADCVVGPRWGQETLRALADSDLVCGKVLPDRAEFVQLPALIRCHGLLEDLVHDLRAVQSACPGWRAGAPLQVHDQSAGASLAFRAEAYLRAGGFDAVPCHEDRLLAGRMAGMGFRVARPDAVRVHASCRLTGRAPGGMASTISLRSRNPMMLLEEARAYRAEALERLSYA